MQTVWEGFWEGKGSKRTLDERTPPGPELFFGLVGSIGANLIAVGDVLSQALQRVRYETKRIRLIGLLSEATDNDLLAKPDSFSSKFTALMDGRMWGSLKAIHADFCVVRQPAVFS